VHYTDYAGLPAKKIWSWGVDPDGLDWRKALSDNNSAYVEVQAGLFRNQETYAFLEPRQTIRFEEDWMPARGIGGIARANLAGVLNLTRHDKTLVAAFNANRKIAPASIRILQGKRVVAEENPSLTPEHAWTHEVKDAGSDPYTFELRDAAGKVLLRQTEGEYDWTPVAGIHTGPQAPPTEGNAVERGNDEELQGETVAALRTYQDGLKQSPGNFALNVAAGRLSACLQRYADAIAYLEPAAAQETWDPEIAYYLGLAYDGEGQSAKARLAYETAARMPSFRAAASLKLGELLARLGDREAALDALRAAKSDLRAAEEAIALERAMGRPLDTPPEGQPSAFIAWDAGGSKDQALLRYLSADPDRVLNIAAQYMRLGLYKSAADLLAREFTQVPSDETEPGAVLPQQHPLVVYYRGYCRAKLGESPAADYAAARKLSTLEIFPSRAEDLEVLHDVLRANPDDMTAHYLLGTQYFARGLTNEALAEWDEVRQAKVPIPVLHADIGRALLRVKHDPTGALQVFREGLTVDPLNLQLYQGLDESLSLMGRPAKELAVSLEHYPDQPHMPAEMVYALALARAEAHEFDGAVALFHDRFFAREEGGTNVRQVWVEVKTIEALAEAAKNQCDAALAITNSLGIEAPGLPFTKDGMQAFVESARTQYLIGQVEAHCGRAAQATERWRRAVADTRPADIVWAWGAAKKLEGYDQQEWTRRLQAARAKIDAERPYFVAILDAVLGKKTEAWAEFQQALLLPDRLMSHHLTRIAMAGVGLPD
jgi:tetratricopeptide (TPR) repeat protein